MAGMTLLGVGKKNPAAQVQVVFTAGTASTQTGSVTSVTCNVPALSSGTQGVDVVINSNTITASLSGSGWTETLTSASQTEPNRLRRFTRSAAGSATITVTLSSSTQAFALGWGCNGTIVSGALSEITSFTSSPSGSAVTTTNLGLIVSAIAASSYPRTVVPVSGTEPSGYDKWDYTGTGGIQIALAWKQVSSGSTGMGGWTPTDPDNVGGGSAAAGEIWRINTTSFQPL